MDNYLYSSEETENTKKYNGTIFKDVFNHQSVDDFQQLGKAW